MESFIENKLRTAGGVELKDELEQQTAIQQVFSDTFTFENIDVLLKNII